jgi:uncharacterized OB-fold protein
MAAFAMPELSRDYRFFLDGLRRRQLLAQRCSNCARLRFPAAPSCPHCASLEWSAEPLSGRGAVHSYIVHYHPPIPPYDAPHPVLLVDMDEGVRVLAALAGPADGIAIGMRVETEFAELGQEVVLNRFVAQGSQP